MFYRFFQYLKNSRLELQKVVWPTKQVLIKHTLAVIVFSLAVAIFLGIIDFGLTKVVELII